MLKLQRIEPFGCQALEHQRQQDDEDTYYHWIDVSQSPVLVFQSIETKALNGQLRVADLLLLCMDNPTLYQLFKGLDLSALTDVLKFFSLPSANAFGSHESLSSLANPQDLSTFRLCISPQINLYKHKGKQKAFDMHFQVLVFDQQTQSIENLSYDQLFRLPIFFEQGALCHEHQEKYKLCHDQISIYQLCYEIIIFLLEKPRQERIFNDLKRTIAGIDDPIEPDITYQFNPLAFKYKKTTAQQITFAQSNQCLTRKQVCQKLGIDSMQFVHQKLYKGRCYNLHINDQKSHLVRYPAWQFDPSIDNDHLKALIWLYKDTLGSNGWLLHQQFTSIPILGCASVADYLKEKRPLEPLIDALKLLAPLAT